MKKSFVLYHDMWETLQHCDDVMLGKVTRLIFEYVTTGKTIEINDPLFFLFNPIKVHLERDNRKYENIIESRSIAGKASAAKRADKSNKSEQRSTSVNKSQQEPTNPTVNVNDNVNVNVNNSYKKMSIQDFKIELAKYRGEFNDEMLQQFFIYWSEQDSKGKMRFQLEKTWSIRGRLARWNINNKNVIRPVNQPQEAKPRTWNMEPHQAK
jgi:hypothetical protein